MTKAKKGIIPAKSPGPDALDIIAEMENATTLNKFFDDNPESFTDDELLQLVQSMRQERPRIDKTDGDE
jgi:hypothetical protein